METSVRPRDGRERKKLATRRALRSATLDLAMERGLAGVPVEEIAARAGVSTRTFFNYFETKEDAALIEVPRIREEDLARVSSGRGAARLWAELGELFAADVERAQYTVEDFPRLLELHDRTPGLIARQLGFFIRQEARIVAAVATRIGGGPAGKMRAELIAGTAMVAGRVGLHSWGQDGEHRPARFHVESAFEVLADTFATAS